MDFINYLTIGIWGVLALLINWWLSKRVNWPRVPRVLLSWVIAAVLTVIIIVILN
jgi:hypothetical protein